MRSAQRGTDHHAFEQRVAGQPIGAVQTGVGGLAHCVQPGQVGSPVEVGDHAAAGVVRGRNHGNGLARDVDAELQAARVDGREMLLQEGLAQVRGIQPHVVQAMLLHLEVDGAGDDVARRQFQPLVVRLHEARAVGQLELAAFAAQRLGDEEAALLRVVQTGRVELDEFHVADAAAGAPGHGDAVAGGSVGVAGVAVDLAHAASGQHHGRRAQRLHALAVHVQRIHAVAARRHFVDGTLEVARGDQVHRHPAFAQC